MGKIVSQDELILLTAREKRNGRRVVFTNGCFDLLHPGHVRCLAEARTLGDLLVVAVNSDGSVRGNKGPERPLVPQNDRAEVLAALAAVDSSASLRSPQCSLWLFSVSSVLNSDRQRQLESIRSRNFASNRRRGIMCV